MSELIIDCNTYLGNWPYWRMDVTTADQLTSHLNKHGIEKALVSSLRSVFYDAEEGNRELMEACKRYPEVLYGLATLTPFSRREDEGYQCLTSGLFKGIRIYPAYHYFSLSASTSIIEMAEATKVPVVIPYRLITSWELPGLSLGEILTLVKGNPKISFVVSCLNYEAYSLLPIRDKHANLFIETSALQHEGAVKTFSDLLGFDKVMFGTATPVQYVEAGIEKILGSKLPKEQEAMVTHQNALRVFSL